MNIKKELREYLALESQVESEKDLLRELHSKIVYTSNVLKGMPGAKSSDKDKLGKSVAKLVDIERKHTRTLEAYTERIEKIDEWYRNLPESIYKTALYWRYMKGFEWLRVQRKLGNIKSADALRVGVNTLIATNSKYFK